MRTRSTARRHSTQPGSSGQRSRADVRCTQPSESWRAPGPVAQQGTSSRPLARAGHRSAIMPMPDPDALFAGVVIAVVAAVPLVLVFGLSGRTMGVAVGLAIGVGVFYPGGTTGLVVDALRPLGTFVRTETERSAARDAAVGEAARSEEGRGG